MQDFGQRVAETEFCPDAKDTSKQIQIKCCTQAALWAQKGPKLEQVNTPVAPFCLKRGALPAGEKREWLRARGHRIFPGGGGAERGGYDAGGHGNSVPRFDVPWGPGRGGAEPFERRARAAQASGRLIFRFRHRVDALTI